MLATRICLIVTKSGTQRERDLTPRASSIHLGLGRTHTAPPNTSGVVDAETHGRRLVLRSVRMCPSGKYAVVDRLGVVGGHWQRCCPPFRSGLAAVPLQMLISSVQTRRNVLHFQGMLIAPFTFPLDQYCSLHSGSFQSWGKLGYKCSDHLHT